jgi:hypothetical protein
MYSNTIEGFYHRYQAISSDYSYTPRTAFNNTAGAMATDKQPPTDFFVAKNQ